MNESLSMPNINSSNDFSDISNAKGSNDFSDISNAKGSINGIPPLPTKKKPQRTFVKVAKVNMNPLLIPLETRSQRQDNMPDVINPTDTPLTDQRASSTIQQLEMKTLNPDKQLCNGYLTPSDPPTYSESSVPCTNSDSPFIPTGGSSKRFHTRDLPILRLDSGVGESLHGSGSVKYNRSPPVYSSTSLSNYPMSTQYEQHYEDIDHYNRVHDYDQNEPKHQESLKIRNGTTRLLLNTTQSGTNRSLPRLNVSGVTCCDSDDCNHANNTHVLNSISGSLHDPVHTYMQLSTNKPLGVSHKPTKTNRERCQVIFALLVILLISLTALGLSIHNMIFNPTNAKQDVDQTIITMQETIKDLIKEKEALMMQQKSLTSFVEEKITQASSQLQNISYTLEVMNDKLEAEIANISLTPGPQGLPGIVNFSECINQSVSMNVLASAQETTETSFLPSLNDTQKYFVTFAYCTYSGATDAYLESQFDDTSKRQRYRCKCWGQVSGVNQTLCKIIIWMCPQES